MVGGVGATVALVAVNLLVVPHARAMLARNRVGIIWWTSGGDSFCSGPMPESDSGCQRQNKLADLVRDPRTAHP